MKEYLLIAFIWLRCTQIKAWTRSIQLPILRIKRLSLQHAYLGDQSDEIAFKVPSQNDFYPSNKDENKRQIAGTMGDIMSSESSISDSKRMSEIGGLTTSDGGTLASKYGICSRLDRMAVTANGNLQRLFSSYYDAPVSVVVESCKQRTPEIWDRVVHLTVFDTVFCTAKSKITIHDTKCRTLVESGEVGLGQLFRYLDRLPTFELCDAGLTENGALWRVYKLNCKEISCTIREDFDPQAWNLN